MKLVKVLLIVSVTLSGLLFLAGNSRLVKRILLPHRSSSYYAALGEACDEVIRTLPTKVSSSDWDKVVTTKLTVWKVGMTDSILPSVIRDLSPRKVVVGSANGKNHSSDDYVVIEIGDSETGIGISWTLSETNGNWERKLSIIESGLGSVVYSKHIR